MRTSLSCRRPPSVSDAEGKQQNPSLIRVILSLSMQALYHSVRAKNQRDKRMAIHLPPGHPAFFATGYPLAAGVLFKIKHGLWLPMPVASIARHLLPFLLAGLCG
jgi:hypothetical protein